MPVSTIWIPTTSGEIDAAWLNAVLPVDVRDGGVVTSVSAEIIGEGVGLLGEVARLTLTYQGAGPRAVTSLISKLPTANEGMRTIGNTFGFYDKEHLFYEQVADRVDIRIPQAYVNLGDRAKGAYVLLLEDMAPRRCGNQLASCSWNDAVVALGELAGFHATWWEHPDLETFAEWLPGPGAAYWEMTRQGYAAGLPKLRPNFSYLLSDEVISLAERYLVQWDDGLRVGALRGPHTFIHGDFRLDNMMFRDHEHGTEFVLLDWQLPFRANPMWDVVYFLAGNFEPAWRRRHQAELVRIYHEGLVGNGVVDYSFEQCWQDYRAAGLVLLGYLVNLAAEIDLDTFNDRGRELGEMMFRRYAEAVEDLGSASFLP
jgi:hypothetical protein